MLCHSLEARNQAQHLNTQTPTHKVTNSLIQTPYPPPTVVGGSEAAAHAFLGFISRLYKCVGDLVCGCLCLYVSFLWVISCFETVTRYTSGGPSCDMSMEALEINVKHASDFIVWRLAKSGAEKYIIQHICVINVCQCWLSSRECWGVLRTHCQRPLCFPVPNPYKIYMYICIHICIYT